MYKERNLCLSCRAEVPERSESRLATHLLSPVPARKPRGQEALGSPAAMEAEDGGLAASIPCLPSPHQPARWAARDRGRESFKTCLAGRMSSCICLVSGRISSKLTCLQCVSMY